ncbi:MAG: hypothetical protein WBB82_11805 [Limnothrix sp.]
MSLRDKNIDWEIKVHDFYVPLTYQGETVGLVDPRYIKSIANVLNGEESIKKALRLACEDLLVEQGKNPNDLSRLKAVMRHYITKTRKPRMGTPAIAALLKERQQELDISQLEFVRFCDSYKLSPDDLKSIYAGEPIASRLFAPLCRILGKDTDELIAILEGRDLEDDEDML